MRNPQAFQVDLRIERKILREVSFEQFAIFGFKNVEGQPRAAFFDRVNNLFELREHSLPEERAANVVDLPIDNIGPHFWVARLFEQKMGQQLFIESRGNFSQE